MNSFEFYQAFTAGLAIIMPIIVWYLEVKSKKDNLYELDIFNKKLEILKKIEELNTYLPQVKRIEQDKIIIKELTEVIKFLNTQENSVTKEKLIKFQNLPKYKKTFLLFKPASFRVFLLQFFCYNFLFIGILYIIVFISVVIDALSGEYWYNRSLMMLVIAVVLFCSSFTLKYFALKFQQKKLSNRTVNSQ